MQCKLLFWFSLNNRGYVERKALHLGLLSVVPCVSVICNDNLMKKLKDNLGDKVCDVTKEERTEERLFNTNTC